MLSHDWNFESHISSLSEQERQYQNPDGFLFINKKFIPKLLSLGVNKKSISKIMIENPKRFFLEQ